MYSSEFYSERSGHGCAVERYTEREIVMYIRVSRRLAGNTLNETAPITLAMRPKTYLTLDNFNMNESALLARHSAMINNLATSVIQSLNSPGPIEVIRLFGHTDSTGNEKHNLGLGDRRARAVAAALQDKLKGFLGRVKIVVEPSPGETDPRADNRTGEGRAIFTRSEEHTSELQSQS